MSGESLLGWLATYALHSTLLIGAAWLVTRRGALASSAARDAVWKIATTGALLTATLQPALPGGFSFGWEGLSPRVGTAGVAMEPPTGATSGALLHPGDPPADTTVILVPRFDAVDPRPPLSEAAAGTSWPTLALTGWLAIAAALLLRHGVRHRRFRRRLGRRREIVDGPVRDVLDDLLRGAGLARRVRLTATSSVASPVALLANEVCVPERALEDLDLRTIRALLAHELAHLARRDALWIEIASGLESLLFFQPLHRLGRHELRSAAEEECDAWAARLTGERHALARCLVEVAGWMRGARAVGAAGMAEPGKGLERRVQRLITPIPDSGGSWRRGVLVGLGMVAAIACGGPAVRPDSADVGRRDPAARERPARPPSVVAARPAATPSGAVEAPPVTGKTVEPDTLDPSERVREYVWREGDRDPWFAFDWSPTVMRNELKRLEKTLERSLESLDFEFRFDPAQPEDLDHDLEVPGILLDPPHEKLRLRAPDLTDVGRAVTAVLPEDRLRVRIDGEVEWGEGTIASVSPGGRVEIVDRREEPSRRLVVTPGEDDEPRFDYEVEGLEQAFDEAGRAWLGDVVERIRSAAAGDGRRVRIGPGLAPNALADIRVFRHDRDRAQRLEGTGEGARAQDLRARLRALEREMERVREEIDRLETEDS